MYKPFYTILESDKHAIIHNIHYFTFYPGTYRITLLNIFPRALRFLFQAQRNLLFFLINADNKTFYLLVKLQYLGWMGYPAPAQIGYMQKSVKTAKVNKHAKVRYILHHSLTQLANSYLFQNLFLTFAALLFDKPAPGHHNISPFNIYLKYLAFNLFADKSAYISRLAYINL